MTIPLVEIRYLGDYIYSPFSGLPAVTEDGENEDDPTLLFTYYGNASLYGYVSRRLQDMLSQDVEDIDVSKLHSLLTVEGGMILEVDSDFNGVNYYGFAPVTKPIPELFRPKN